MTASSAAAVAAGERQPTNATDTVPTVHRLPIRSSFRGTTDVAVNFYPTIRKRQRDAVDEALLAQFRGRRLIGTRVSLESDMLSAPEPYTGAVFVLHLVDSVSRPSMSVAASTRDTDSAMLDSETLAFAQRGNSARGTSNTVSTPARGEPFVLSNRVEVVHQFQSFVMWEHDRDPDPRDSRSVSLWLRLAESIHTSV